MISLTVVKNIKIPMPLLTLAGASGIPPCIRLFPAVAVYAEPTNLYTNLKKMNLKSA
jgi:hypothetical protein